jgi:hypothetical protein
MLDYVAATISEARVPGGQSIVLAIVGGTLLTLALTRPRLRWVERLTEHTKSGRLWAERGLTLFSFAVGGYAWATLFMTLRGQLDANSADLVRGAAYILIAYAALTHFEPFVGDDDARNIPSALALYGGWAILAACLGVATAETVRTASVTAGRGIALVALAAATVLFAISWLTSRLGADPGYGSIVPSDSVATATADPPTNGHGPTQTQARSTKA